MRRDPIQVSNNVMPMFSSNTVIELLDIEWPYNRTVITTCNFSHGIAVALSCYYF